MSGSRSKKGKDKGSWNEAAAEYKKGWFAKFGMGFFHFDTPEIYRCEEPQADESADNARVFFRTALTLLLRGCLDFRPVYTSEEEQAPKGLLEFRPSCAEDATAANGLIAQVLFRFLKGDEQFFGELMKLRRKLPDPTKEAKGGIDALPLKMGVYLCADELRRKLGRDPTRAEVEDRMYQNTKLRPKDFGSVFDSAKLGFLEDNRGRPPKKRTGKV